MYYGSTSFRGFSQPAQPLQRFGLVQTVAPVEPVTVEEIREWSESTKNFEDTVILGMIKTARSRAERATGLQLCTATWAAYYDRFPAATPENTYAEINLPHAPIQSVTSVVYVDTAGNTQTMVANTDYTVDLYRGRIAYAYSNPWPCVRDTVNSVTITYVAGYGAATSVPEDIKTAIKDMAVDMLVNRGGPFRTPPRAQEILDQNWTGAYG